MKNSVCLPSFIKAVICDTGMTHVDLKELQPYIEMLMFWCIEKSAMNWLYREVRMKMTLIYVSEDSGIR